jgi:hypothetical protein
VNYTQLKIDPSPSVVYDYGSRLGGVKVSVLAIGPKVCKFKPGQSDGYLKGNKSPQHAFLRRGSKAGGSVS